jgi:anti-anti-sigma regulatory factor
MRTYGRLSTSKSDAAKLEALLPEMDEVLVIDFRGITSVSSSFLDELLGRFVSNLGVSKFESLVRVVNVEPDIERMANVVIEQRLSNG